MKQHTEIAQKEARLVAVYFATFSGKFLSIVYLLCILCQQSVSTSSPFNQKYFTGGKTTIQILNPVMMGEKAPKKVPTALEESNVDSG